MSLDRHAAERRRFARLLGIDGELGCGLPIGSHSSQSAEADGGNTDDAPRDASDAPDETDDSIDRRSLS
ncbi:hypothetical protein GS429_16340 [Natronorubrum sp. JWXQ-INN-674]|uniref:Uncharacterized protein n=1 Tax=Natronorubrum halalkaliphilum TaxID=2691917 RepID=A0A6B0VQ21_9EURY|nr:hypothetical protein [Natronorubrum halalkaliphilum]MXV63598.1 hypothetical protein [Natronorubrum halalkaliphilum]